MSSYEDEIERFERETPEFKLELRGGRLVVGNSLAGSRYCLHDLLTGWRPEAALAFAPPSIWLSALQQAFGEFRPPEAEVPLCVWKDWAETVVFEPYLAPAGPVATDLHHSARERMSSGAYHAGGAGGFGKTLGRDFVMRLGEDGLTADGFIIGRQAAERLFQRFLNGPADVVWEILLPGHEWYDMEDKFHAYEAGGVPDYWVVDPERRRVDFFVLQGGKYQSRTPDADGRYRPFSFRGLAFLPERLWQPSEPQGAGVFEIETALPGGWKTAAMDGIGWDDVPFSPRPVLEPKPVLFEEFAAWCPRAKFESDGERTIIEGSRGSRNVLGMLLGTFGLNEAVKLLHPRDWVSALMRVKQAQKVDSARKLEWWDLARKAAALLRAHQGATRVAVIGDLTRKEPLHFWSELSLVAWDLSGGTFDAFDHLRDLDTERVIEIIDPKHASGVEKKLIEAGAIDV